jgi:hypothetical protein
VWSETTFKWLCFTTLITSLPKQHNNQYRFIRVSTKSNAKGLKEKSLTGNQFPLQLQGNAAFIGT